MGAGTFAAFPFTSVRLLFLFDLKPRPPNQLAHKKHYRRGNSVLLNLLSALSFLIHSYRDRDQICQYEYKISQPYVFDRQWNRKNDEKALPPRHMDRASCHQRVGDEDKDNGRETKFTPLPAGNNDIDAR